MSTPSGFTDSQKWRFLSYSSLISIIRFLASGVIVCYCCQWLVMGACSGCLSGRFVWLVSCLTQSRWSVQPRVILYNLVLQSAPQWGGGGKETPGEISGTRMCLVPDPSPQSIYPSKTPCYCVWGTVKRRPRLSQPDS